MKQYLKTIVFYCLTIAALLLCVVVCSKTATVFAEKETSTRTTCVVIDPGHGGEDGGAVSCTGIPESIYNLNISQRVQDLLHMLGYQTIMTRKTDISIYTKGETLSEKKFSDLKQRVKIANATDGALLLSIHQNYFQESQYYGAQVFYARTEGSEALAKKLQAELAGSINPGSRRQAKQCTGIYLMEHIHCPGILIECGFLSNSREEEKLRDTVYQKKLSAVIAVTTSRFLSNT